MLDLEGRVIKDFVKANKFLWVLDAALAPWFSFLSNLTALSFLAQMVKRLPTMRETRVRSLGWEDLLEKEIATHSSILAWRIPWTEGAWYRITKGRTQLKRLSMYIYTYGEDWASLVAQLWRIHPLMQETWVWSLGWEDLLEKEIATHSSILASRTPRI